METYKLAFIIERYFEFGGQQRDMRRFARACAQKGHHVTVYTSRWDGPKDELLHVEIVPFSGSANHQRVLSVQKFAQSLQNEKKYDCIVGFTRVKGLDVYFSADPCYITKHRQRGKLISTLLSYLPRYRTYINLEKGVFGPESDSDVMVISPYEFKTVKQEFNIDSNRLFLLAPGIDRERLTRYDMTADKRKAFRAQYGIDDDGFIILTIGSHFQTKGIDRGIKAIASLPDDIKQKCHYIVIGKGDQKKFQSLANHAGIGKQITFTGGREDIGAFYYASDLYLHPSRTDTAGHTLLEAMICSLPVIVTDHCGYAPYVYQAQGGQLIPSPFNQNTLNTMLNDYLSDPDLRMRYSKAAYKYTQTADIYSMTEQAVSIILNRARKNRGAK